MVLELTEDPAYMAKLAEQTERFDDMVEFMKKYIDDNRDITEESRNLLSIAYKNVVGNKRSAWRAVSNLEQKEKEKAKDNKDKKPIQSDAVKWYRNSIEDELHNSCVGILELLEKPQFKKSGKADEEIFHQKMKGDYNRYLCEFAKEEKLEKYSTEAHICYKRAQELADNNLPAKNTLRLGVALNYSVFNYEILNNPNAAFLIAKQAFDMCLEDLSINNKDEDYKDATTILQLLDENMNMWSMESQEQAEKNA